MTALALLQDGWARLVFALLASLVYGAAASLFLFLCLKSLKARYAEARYWMGVLALAAVLGLTFATWSALGYSDKGVAVSETRHEAGSERVLEVGESAAKASVQKRPYLFWIQLFAWLWILGSATMVIRSIGAVSRVEKLRHAVKPVEDPRILELFHALRRRLGIARHVALAAGDRIGIPSTVGFFKPVVFLPLSLLSGIPAGQLESVLLHELAHVRRADYLVNLFQMMVEDLLFFNPGVRWINRQIRVEREAACDALAARGHGRPDHYAKALAELVSGPRFTCGEGAALALVDGSAGSLLDRAKRLLVPGYHPRIDFHWRAVLSWFAGSGAVLSGMFFITQEVVTKSLDWYLSREQVREMEHLFDAMGDQPGRETEPLIVAGRIATEDGRPLPPKAWIRYYHVPLDGREDPGFANRIQSKRLDLDGEYFFTYLLPGEVAFHLFAPGYGHTLYEFNLASPDVDSENLVLMLKNERRIRVEVRNEEGEPLPIWKAYAILPLPDGTRHKLPYTIEGRGVLVLEQYTDSLLGLQIVVHGYQSYWRAGALPAEESFQVTLRRAAPTTGRVIAKKTGEPIAGAEVFVYAVVNERHFPIKPEERNIVITDAQGRFVFDYWDDDVSCYLVAKAKGFGNGWAPEVRAGDTDIQIELGPAIRASGIISGDLERLAQKRDRANVYAFSRFRGGLERLPVEEQWVVPTVVGDGRAAFSTEGLWPGELILFYAYKEQGQNWTRVSLGTWEIGESLENLELHLEEPPSEGNREGPPPREVVVRLDLPPEATQPKGSIRALLGSSRSSEKARRLDVPFQDGQARFLVPEPFTFRLYSKGLIGYAFEPTELMTVPEQGQPHEVLLVVVPAGALHGRVSGLDSPPVLVIYKKGGHEVAWVGNNDFFTIRDADLFNTFRPLEDARFMATPLRLDTAYIAVARLEHALVFSEPVMLTREDPIRELQIEFPPLAEIEGAVYGPDGEPIPHVHLLLTCLNYEADLDILPTTTVHTESDGRYVFKNVNPNYGYRLFLDGLDVEGENSLMIRADQGPFVFYLKKNPHFSK